MAERALVEGDLGNRPRAANVRKITDRLIETTNGRLILIPEAGDSDVETKLPGGVLELQTLAQLEVELREGRGGLSFQGKESWLGA